MRRRSARRAGVPRPRLAADADIVVLSLPNPTAVRAVMTGPDGVLEGIKPGTVILDTSTIDPATSREMYAPRDRRGRPLS